jgi:hypothetical protein
VEFWTRKVLVAMGEDPESLRLGDAGHLDRAVELAMTALASRDLRAGGVSIASEILMRWRTPFPELISGLVGCVEDRDREWDHDALDVLAAVAAANPLPDFDSIVPILVDEVRGQYDRRAVAAALALARLRHPAAVAPVQTWLTGTLPFLTHPVNFGHVLAPLVDHADALMPGIRATLAATGGEEWLRPVLLALASWGPAAAPAVPELTPILNTRNARWACTALGSIGPAAVPAADLIDRFARGSQRPPRTAGGSLPVDSRGWHGSQVAAWAHWKITGESATAVAVLGAAITRAVGAGAAHCDLALLADLGTDATDYEEPVRALLGSAGRWTRVQAANALWRIAGRAELVVPVLLDTLGTLNAGHADAECRAAVRCLAEIGAEAAGAAIPALETVLGSDRRFASDAGPLAVVQDVELSLAIRSFLGTA